MSRAERLALACLTTVAAIAAAAVAAQASAPPVGPLPVGPRTSIQTVAGERVAVALPRGSKGKVWRIARAFNGSVVQEISEANVGTSVVVIFRAVGKGTTTVSFGLTLGERAKAYAARTFVITVR
jgi:hypothetical protein